LSVHIWVLHLRAFVFYLIHVIFSGVVICYLLFFSFLHLASICCYSC
jgi:hypothetical protein